MTFVTATQPDQPGICRARGGVEVNNLPGIDTAGQAAISKLNDLASLLAAQRVLSSLDSEMGTLERFSSNGALRVSQAINSASGDTAIEKYLKALQGVVDSLNAEDKPRAQSRITLLTNALTELRALALSPSAVSRLTTLESSQSGIGVAKSLAAVRNLVTQLASELNIPQDELNETKINALVKERCQAGVRAAAAVVTPPVATPPVTPPVTNAPERSLVDYGIVLLPAYSLLLAGEETAPVESGPALHGRLSLGFNLSKEMKLQFDYQPYLNLNTNFETSRQSQDFATASFAYKMTDLTIIGQGGYLWDKNILADTSRHEGTAGIGVSLFNGLLYPFAGALLGTDFGAYGGVRSTYNWKDPKIALSGQALYSYLNSHQIAGSIVSSWSPVSFWGADLRLGLGVGSEYNVDAEAAGLSLGLIIGLTGSDLLVPQPVRWGGF